MIKVLHLTAHLGGGVGKALSGLAMQAASSGSDVRHTIVTFEQQEKSQFAELVEQSGSELIVCPPTERLHVLIGESDVVQLEWWNHPATMAALCGAPLPPMRLLVWSHVSGLFNPIIPEGLLLAAHKFLFTSACSFQAKEVRGLPSEVAQRIGVVSSCAGFQGFPSPTLADADATVAGYLGSLNFAKLHPDYVDFLAEVKIPGFSVRLIGDLANKETLERQCAQRGNPGLLEFRGYTSDVASELASLNVLAYLLNPQHYGTTENALLEAMSMGVVPVVLDNPAECLIVEHEKTGLVVGSKKEFAAAMHRLAKNPGERRAMGLRAAESVRRKFSAAGMEASLNAHYRECISLEKRAFSFTDIFGAAPSDWFLSCQGSPRLFSLPGTTGEPGRYSKFGLFEQTKGTVFHFRKYFPDDERLNQWSKKLLSLQ